MKRTMLALLLSLGLATITAISAAAAPITCPPGQEVVKDSPGVWYCENNGGSGDPNTEETRNPTD